MSEQSFKTYTVPEVARDFLKCSVPNVHRLIKSGELVAIVFGRRVIVEEAEISAFLTRHRTRRAG